MVKGMTSLDMIDVIYMTSKKIYRSTTRLKSKGKMVKGMTLDMIDVRWLPKKYLSIYNTT